MLEQPPALRSALPTNHICIEIAEEKIVITMFYRLRNSFSRARYRHSCSAILETSPLKPTGDEVVFVSMVSHADLLMYLVAVKSISRWIAAGRIVVINDGSLTNQDRQILNHHLSHPEIISIERIATDPCPRGGTWERLLAIIDFSQKAFTVQIDSDLLAIADLTEVRTAIEQNRCFILPTAMGREIIDFDDAAKAVANLPSDHVQIVAERSFPLLTYSRKRYVRGCSGFAGFATGAVTRDTIERFSGDLEKRIGRKWFEWGSEQVASNFLLANTPDPVVLPYPKYANYSPSLDHAQTHLFHFIGETRFKQGTYVKSSRDVISALKLTPTN